MSAIWSLLLVRAAGRLRSRRRAPPERRVAREDWERSVWLGLRDACP